MGSGSSLLKKAGSRTDLAFQTENGGDPEGSGSPPFFIGKIYLEISSTVSRAMASSSLVGMTQTSVLQPSLEIRRSSRTC